MHFPDFKKFTTSDPAILDAWRQAFIQYLANKTPDKEAELLKIGSSIKKLKKEKLTSDALFLIALCEEHLSHVDNALPYLDMAISEGNAEAMYTRALYHETGRSKPTNPEAAAYLYKLAADKGHANALAKSEALKSQDKATRQFFENISTTLSVATNTSGLGGMMGGLGGLMGGLGDMGGLMGGLGGVNTFGLLSGILGMKASSVDKISPNDIKNLFTTAKTVLKQTPEILPMISSTVIPLLPPALQGTMGQALANPDQFDSLITQGEQFLQPFVANPTMGDMPLKDMGKDFSKGQAAPILDALDIFQLEMNKQINPKTVKSPRERVLLRKSIQNFCKEAKTMCTLTPQQNSQTDFNDLMGKKLIELANNRFEHRQKVIRILADIVFIPLGIATLGLLFLAKKVISDAPTFYFNKKTNRQQNLESLIEEKFASKPQKS